MEINKKFWNKLPRHLKANINGVWHVWKLNKEGERICVPVTIK